MNIVIRGHHLVVTPALEEKITAQLAKVTKSLDDVSSIQAKLQKAHRLTSLSHKGLDNHIAEVILRLPGKEFFAHAAADDMYQAITLVCEKLRRQLARYKVAKVA